MVLTMTVVVDMEDWWRGSELWKADTFLLLLSLLGMSASLFAAPSPTSRQYNVQLFFFSPKSEEIIVRLLDSMNSLVWRQLSAEAAALPASFTRIPASQVPRHVFRACTEQVAIISSIKYRTG